MSFISAGNTTTTTLVVNGDTTGNLVFNTGGANTTALTLTNTQNATFANTVTATKGFVVGATAAPAFSAYQTTGTSLGASTTTKVLFDTELFDTNNNFASSTFTPTVAGYYQVNACVFVSGTTSALLTILSASNGASKSGSYTNLAGQSQAASMASAVMYFNGSTDYVEVQVYSGAALTTLTGQYTHFSATFVRSA
jgi:hypothetical protein